MTRTIELLTADVLAEEAGEAQAWVDDGVAFARIVARLGRSQAALGIIDALGIEGLRVERITEKRMELRVDRNRAERTYVTYAARDCEPTEDPMEGIRASVVVNLSEPTTVQYGGAWASAEHATIVAGLMLLAAVDVESRVST